MQEISCKKKLREEIIVFHKQIKYKKMVKGIFLETLLTA